MACASGVYREIKSSVTNGSCDMSMMSLILLWREDQFSWPGFAGA
jgi:hypothetical protein